ncbi:MAG: hypothetical protein DU430_05330 [Candidatus Tokpelaia sp.]|nr:MAG: hypothetical protein DU430_05330 [Candidatus Tokpelaia sp.]
MEDGNDRPKADRSSTAILFISQFQRLAVIPREQKAQAATNSECPAPVLILQPIRNAAKPQPNKHHLRSFYNYS